MKHKWHKGDEAWKFVCIGDGKQLSGVHFDTVTVEGYWKESGDVKCHNYYGQYGIDEDKLYKTLNEAIQSFVNKK